MEMQRSIWLPRNGILWAASFAGSIGALTRLPLAGHHFELGLLRCRPGHRRSSSRTWGGDPRGPARGADETAARLRCLVRIRAGQDR